MFENRVLSNTFGPKRNKIQGNGKYYIMRRLTLNLPTTTIVAQPFNVIKWQLKFNPVA